LKPTEQYIINQPEPYRAILMHLQVIVENVIPEAELKYKYKIPFYYIYGKPFCYFNASHKRHYVDVGFVKGQQIQIHKDHLITENRKKMVSLRYISLESIDDSVLIDVLNSAKNLY
tara:strand:+ start:2308 stop:2655 length:348 start_codon:yes stop_codon:yes gene_type:complete